MDTPKMVQAMKDSISEVLEQMFFLPIDLVEADKDQTFPPRGDGETYTAQVGFDGAVTGTFLLNIPTGLAASISADFLGTIAEELTAEEITGTVTEMLNMLAGNSLSAYDPEASFNLRIPELTDSPADNNGKPQEIIDIGIETMESRMSLNMMA